ncbi:hypothetical protein BV22DRAFT_280660 [Leucogyrophana mollusca]|uniref:Uncharacterized protein n=1 Tax=Leucogyrophana mollusca TaxID=85980 RepID=A0ACB8BNL3_9AGAM|nr:hypothetical protein BV22DRAFT_280660 [Leucogyrophana mollusca]
MFSGHGPCLLPRQPASLISIQSSCQPSRSAMAPRSITYSTTTETSSDLYIEKVFLVSNTVVPGIAYGVMFSLYFVCARSLLRGLRVSTLHQPTRFRTWCHFGYISTLFIFGTLHIIISVFVAVWDVQVSYIGFDNFPGGPLAYISALRRGTVAQMWAVSYLISNWMADCLVLWRLFVLYYGSRYRKWVIIFSSTLFVGNIVMGIFVAVCSSAVNQQLHPESTMRYSVSYYALSLSESVIATICVVARLYMHKRRLDRTLGPDHASPYTSIAIMTIESSGLYVMWSLIFVILYVVGNPIQYAFATSLPHMQIIAPLLLVYKVSQGKVWTRTTDPALSTVKFAPNPQSERDDLESSETL